MLPTAQLPPFIETQSLRLLLEAERPERFLRAEYFRAGRAAGPALGQVDRGTWSEVDRLDVAHNRVPSTDGRPCDLKRLVLTTDAGVGKTVTLRWLHAVLNQPGSNSAAFFLIFSHLPARPAELLREGLLPQFMAAQESSLAEATALAQLERLRVAGRLVLLLDGLDQAPPDGTAVATVKMLAQDPAWRVCRVVVSGRPHALQRHWADLFATELGYGWRFLQVDEFDEGQQRQFLGQTSEGRSRFDLVPSEAREILSTPRVLEYLRGLPDGELQQICTASDVYWLSLKHLLAEGMKHAPETWRLGLAPQEPQPTTLQQRSLLRARKLLGAIAFQMTATLVARPAVAGPELARGTERVPNFDGVPAGQYEDFKKQLVDRLKSLDPDENQRLLERDLDALAALNDFLSHGIFDLDLIGLDRIYWRNRTLQEFFAAFWLTQFCTPQDADGLWDWVYQPEQPLTEEYYWVWRFLCEMHPDARDPQAWTRAVASLFRPGDGTPQGTKRSTEMLFRAWPALEQTIREGSDDAHAVQAGFLGEFETVILAGHRGPEAKAAAEQFCASFIEVPAGEFRMGSPPEKQGMPEDLKRQWKACLEQDGDPEELANERMKYWIYPPTKQGQRMREDDKHRWSSAFRDRDVEHVAQVYYPVNETPAAPLQKVPAFLLSRSPTINAWYRLFKLGHGQRACHFQEPYAKISSRSDTPLIYVTWHDAWVFCQWAHWNGRSCRLPREYEWEYAAKAGTPWDWNYWWGDEFDPEKCNADQRVGHTTPPDAAHANPWGFQDILGGVWEWTEDECRRAYDRDRPPDCSAHVLRGGSWASLMWYSRSAFRNIRPPSNSNLNVGFRVARDMK